MCIENSTRALAAVQYPPGRKRSRLGCTVSSAPRCTLSTGSCAHRTIRNSSLPPCCSPLLGGRFYPGPRQTDPPPPQRRHPVPLCTSWILTSVPVTDSTGWSGRWSTTLAHCQADHCRICPPMESSSGSRWSCLVSSLTSNAYCCWRTLLRCARGSQPKNFTFSPETTKMVLMPKSATLLSVYVGFTLSAGSEWELYTPRVAVPLLPF